MREIYRLTLKCFSRYSITSYEKNNILIQTNQASRNPTMQQKNNNTFASALENLALASFSDKHVNFRIIASNKTLTESNKTLTANITSWIQHGTVNRGQKTQTS